VYFSIPSRGLNGSINLSATAFSDLNQAISDAPISKALNSIELTEALYRFLATPHYTIKGQASYGTIPELAFTVAIKVKNILNSSLVAAARESFVCRSRDEKKTTSYGSELSFRDALPDSFKKVCQR
jgi:hypothetical protein